ncbi:MAG: YdcF family protein [Leptothrix sp. (in: b-proteobacteria)]
MSDLAAWKPVIAALLLPPASLLLLILVGTRIAIRRRIGSVLVLLCVALLWLSCCLGTGRWMQDRLLKPPAALTAETLAELRTLAPPTRQARSSVRAAIVVLGAGRHRHSAEYGGPNLTEQGMARLRYGVWVARETGLPMAYAGGVGWAQSGEVSEAEAAERILRQEYNLPPRWQETKSHDTRENAKLLAPMLLADGVRTIVLVTHAAHMPRAMRAFSEASGGELRIIPAPLGFATRDQSATMDWLPTTRGYQLVQDLLHELVGLSIGV